VASRFLYLMRHAEASELGTLSARGQEQARLAGERLRDVPLAGIYHSPQERAASTAQIISAYVPGVPVLESVLLDEYIPSDPDVTELPAPYANLVQTYTPRERSAGAALALDALERFGGARSGDADTHELLVTHNFLIGWFVRDALGAADWRWLGLNQQHAALTTIMYRPGVPPALVSFNDAAHLNEALRWTGFPHALRPATH
jgi:probable phosphoglycerate mutase